MCWIMRFIMILSSITKKSFLLYKNENRAHFKQLLIPTGTEIYLFSLKSRFGLYLHAV